MSLRLSSRDWFAAAALWLATFAVYAPGATRRGFYADDAGMLVSLPFTNLSALPAAIAAYVPGRNLHILWQYLLFKLAGSPLPNLPALHLMQAALDGLAVASFFVLLRLLSLPAHVAALAAVLFSFWPNHGETHFWLSSAPMNLVSTLGVMLFAGTSLALAAERPPRWWVRLLDAMAFAGALFTYDQVFFALMLIVALRLALVMVRRGLRVWSFALAHIPYAAAGIFYVWLKLRIGAGDAPSLRAEAWSTARFNVMDSISHTFGRYFIRDVARLYENATAADWLWAIAVGGALTALVFWLLYGSPTTPNVRLSLVFVLSVAFFIVAYIPVWSWYIASRHHYLPTVGLFAGGAVCLAAILERLPRAARAMLLAMLTAASVPLIAANRGESRFWEESFTLKKQLFTDLKPELGGAEILVLDDFPASHGPAPLLVSQDARFAPSLLFHGLLSLGRGFTGDIAGAPAPGGYFLHTLPHLDGVDGFRYYPAAKVVMAHFTALRGDRLLFEKKLPDAFEILSSKVVPHDGAFQIYSASARRDGDNVLISLRLQDHNPSGCYLAASLSVLHQGGFHHWGRLNPQGALKLFPILLSEPGPHPRPGGWQRELTLRVFSFPRTERLLIEFYSASRDNPPRRLGGVELAVAP